MSGAAGSGRVPHARDLAQTLLSGLPGRWRHTVGVARVDGARHLDSLGWPPRIIALVAHHSGARFVAHACGLGTDLDTYPRELTAVSDALTYADQTIGPTGERMTVTARMTDMLRRHGPDSPEARVHPLREPHLRGVADRVEQRLRGLGMA